MERLGTLLSARNKQINRYKRTYVITRDIKTVINGMYKCNTDG